MMISVRTRFGLAYRGVDMDIDRHLVELFMLLLTIHFTSYSVGSRFVIRLGDSI